jgi:hypothetical protein
MQIKTVSRTSIIDFYLDQINKGMELTNEQTELICQLLKDLEL